MDHHITTRPGHHNHLRVGSGSREDCWTEDATETLIEAWGDRYLKLNKGNLRQKDWKDVADAVNNYNYKNNVVKPRSDVQCKNRIDTLKKKYKLEKAKTTPSKWPFYHRLDSLIGSNAAVNKKPTIVTFTIKSSSSIPTTNPSPVLYSGESKSKSKSTESLSGDDDNDDRTVRKEAVELSDEGVACRELARAILRFGEIYERIERSKQQQMMELERERMEFNKDLEFRRLNMFVDAQLQIERESKRENNRAKSKSG